MLVNSCPSLFDVCFRVLLVLFIFVFEFSILVGNSRGGFVVFQVVVLGFGAEPVFLKSCSFGF